MVCVLVLMYCHRNTEENKALVQLMWRGCWKKKKTKQVIIN